MKRLCQVVIILIGILIILYPKIVETQQNFRQKQLMAQWKQNVEEVSIINNTLSDMLPETKVEIETEFEAEVQTELETSKKLDENVIGILKIDKIGLELPVLKGSTEKNMNISLTTVEPTGNPGEIGNLAIAGHNNSQYGRNFNRLGELEQNDNIIVDIGTNAYKYMVTEKLYVKPEEVWVLSSNDTDSIITLITCYPRVSATQRLIIRGKLSSD